LASDTVALIDAIDAGPVHIIGHDWGAMVGYAVAAIYPNRVRTLTSLAVPHPGAFMKSLLSSTQALRSWYMLAFQLPGIPEAVIRKWPDRFVRGLESTGQAHENAVRDTEFINKNGITTTLNWYRAIPLTDPRTVKDKVTVPTLHVYGAKDGAIARRGAELNGEFIVAPYTLKILENTSHWIPEEEPGEVVRLFKEMVSAFG
jgi:pimeloyl-ACP methyl ester carboxylesterase